ncbi:MAG: glycerophosphoryl diester phosphodiesterase [Blastocatellia bacterium]|jgi:glycerophosphoryl diester phosphodiesterase|nr:glycerophosphoryl diester phosphodiesterase [Blastocatellia bacterium]
MNSEAGSLLIIGHRGASAHAPENTLVAFALAFEAGADGIEFDVRLARDQVPVVIHDANLRRTALKEGSIAALSSTELCKTDVGSWFNLRHPSRARAGFTGTNIPTLSQVFEMYGGRATLYVELKCEAGEINALASEVAALINSHSLTEHVVVKSFTLDAIREIKRLDARIRTAALFERKLTRPAPSARRIIEDALACGADQLSLQRTLASRRMLDEAMRRGLKTVVWTVDDPAWIERARRAGVHALITNDPAMMRDALLKG